VKTARRYRTVCIFIGCHAIITVDPLTTCATRSSRSTTRKRALI
jgi:hypothetical protein